MGTLLVVTGCTSVGGPSVPSEAALFEPYDVMYPESPARALFEFTVDGVRDAYSYLDYKETRHGFEWGELVDRYRAAVSSADTEEEVLFLLDELVSILNDGHTSVDAPPLKLRSLPLGVEPRDGVLRVTCFHEAFAAYPDALDLGDELVAIDGRDAHRAYAELRRNTGYPVARGETDRFAGRFLRTYYFRHREEIAKAGYRSDVTIGKADGTSTELSMTWSPLRRVQTVDGCRTHEPRNDGESVEFRLMDGIGVLRIRGFSGDTFLEQVKAALVELAAESAEALILDIRGNGGGDYTVLAQGVIGHLIDRPTPTASKRFRNSLLLSVFGAGAPHVPEPGESPGEYAEPVELVAEPRAPGFDGPVYVLADGRHFSAADMFLAAVADLELAAVVGRTRELHSGQPIRIDTQWHDATVSISTMVSRGPSGRITEGRRIPPDVAVPLTKAEIYRHADGTDPLLFAALAAARGDSR